VDPWLFFETQRGPQAKSLGNIDLSNSTSLEDSVEAGSVRSWLSAARIWKTQRCSLDHRANSEIRETSNA
jgi:hypothetical protein